MRVICELHPVSRRNSMYPRLCLRTDYPNSYQQVLCDLIYSNSMMVIVSWRNETIDSMSVLTCPLNPDGEKRPEERAAWQELSRQGHYHHLVNHPMYHHFPNNLPIGGSSPILATWSGISQIVL